ncbi:9240_t:CDS:2 [Acaulospora colombiana]|uniref:9240_t:CDS:1 n=1 Tax=Acaulospora colombiana TaxID=27376 RepID=A0ACA9KQ02_9GLOM|nr:9240_t:CDS:2 [Acaulospora colombiana]
MKNKLTTLFQIKILAPGSSNRGVALGTPLGLFGLSAFVFSQINSSFFKSDVYHFLVFVAISTGLCQFIGACFLVDVPPIPMQCDEVVTVITTNPASYDHHQQDVNDTHDHKTQKHVRFTEQTPLIGRSDGIDDRHEHHEQRDICGWELIQNGDARLLFIAILFIGGTGLMYINNVGTMIKSLYTASIDDRHPLPGNDQQIEMHRLQSLHVSIISICSCIGRFSAGLFSDFTKYMYKLRRLWFIIVAGLLLFVGHMLCGFLVKDLDLLWATSILNGLGCGFMFGIAPTITTEWFGSRRFGFNWYETFYASSLGNAISVCMTLGLLVWRMKRDIIRWQWIRETEVVRKEHEETDSRASQCGVGSNEILWGNNVGVSMHVVEESEVENDEGEVVVHNYDGLLISEICGGERNDKAGDCERKGFKNADLQYLVET